MHAREERAFFNHPLIHPTTLPPTTIQPTDNPSKTPPIQRDLKPSEIGTKSTYSNKQKAVPTTLFTNTFPSSMTLLQSHLNNIRIQPRTQKTQYSAIHCGKVTSPRHRSERARRDTSTEMSESLPLSSRVEDPLDPSVLTRTADSTFRSAFVSLS